MTSRVIRALVAVAAAAVVAGCDTTATTGGAPAPSVPALPPRTGSVAADQVAPCTMLTAAQASRLGLRRPTPGLVTVNDLPSAGCTWLGRDGGINVQHIPIDAEVGTTAPGAVVTRVNGFGAVRDMPDPNGGPPVCQVLVDVAPRQSIRVQATSIPNPPYGLDELCRRADEAASMVMTTVVATAPR